MLTMNDLSPKDFGVILQINESENTIRRYGELGINVGSIVECVGRSLLGDPKAYRIRGSVLALRNCDSKNIIVKRVRHNYEES